MRNSFKLHKDKEKLFFRHLSGPASSQYNLRVATSITAQSSVRTTNRTNSIQSDSLELDHNIQEALKTLRINEMSGRCSQTPRRTHTSASNSHLIRNARNTQVDQTSELEEFLELEKRVQQDVKTVTVNLAVSNSEKTLDNKASGGGLQELKSGLSRISPIRPVQAMNPADVLIMKHRKYINRVRETTFNSKVVLRLAFSMWKSS